MLDYTFILSPRLTESSSSVLSYMDPREKEGDDSENDWESEREDVSEIYILN